MLLESAYHGSRNLHIHFHIRFLQFTHPLPYLVLTIYTSPSISSLLSMLNFEPMEAFIQLYNILRPSFVLGRIFISQGNFMSNHYIHISGSNLCGPRRQLFFNFSITAQVKIGPYGLEQLHLGPPHTL